MSTRLLTCHSEVQKILAEFTEAKKRMFGIPGVTSIAFKFEHFYKTLAAAAMDHTSNEYIDILNRDPQSDQARYRGGAKAKTAIYVNFAVAAHGLLQQKTKTAHGTGEFPCAGYDERPSPGRFLGYEFEDWNRAVWTLKLAAYQANDSRKSTANDVNARNISARNNIAMLPYVLTAEDKTTLVEDDALSDVSDDKDTPEQKSRKRQYRLHKAVQKMEACFSLDDVPEDTRALLTSEDVDSGLFKEHAENLEKRLNKLFGTAHSSQAREERPQVAKSEVLRFMWDQSRNVRVLWSPDDCNRVRSEAAKGLEASAFSDLLELSDMQSKSAEDATAGEPDDDEKTLDERRAGLSWEIRKLMGSKAAPIPPLGPACEWAQVSPDDLTIAGAAQDPVTGERPSYKPHQILS